MTGIFVCETAFGMKYDWHLCLRNSVWNVIDKTKANAPIKHITNILTHVKCQSNMKFILFTSILTLPSHNSPQVRFLDQELCASLFK